MNYTTLKQSKKLLELGLDTETADMYLKKSPILNPKEKWIPRIINNLPILFDDDDVLPCWSLEALLKLLREYGDCDSLSIFTNRAQKWRITISYYDIVWKEHEEININLLEASYNTVVWLLENGYIKTCKEK